MAGDPKKQVRGAVKLAGVVVAAGLIGAGAGIGLAKLTGSDDSGAPQAVATSGPAATATATATVAATQTAATAGTPYREPRFEVFSAQLATPDPATGRARVTARISVTNRNSYALRPRTPVLTSEGDEVTLDAGARDAAGPLLRPIDAGDTATGDLRFTLPAAVAQRVGAAGSARLRIAGRTINLRLQTTTAEAPG